MEKGKLCLDIWCSFGGSLKEKEMIKLKSSMKNVVFITVICWSTLREKWSIRVVSSEILILAVRF